MKGSLILAAMLAGLAVFSPSASAFRCGDGNRFLATEGMHKHQILKDCGPPASSEIVGYDEKGGSYRIAEEWLYVIDDHGRRQVYLIKFDRDGLAVRIEWLGEQKN